MISSYIDLLQRRYSADLDDKALGFMGHVVDGAKRMKTLIDDLLTFSQLGAADNLKPERIDISSLIKQITEDLSAQIEPLGATVEAEQLPMVYASRSQLSMLLRNLIDNALKYHGDQAPQIRITVDAQASQWLFCVSDNGIGIGIDPKQHARIFDLFKRLHTRSEIAGTGIGLAACQRIVQRCGGRIWIASQIGEGAQFFFTIPRVDPDA